MFKRAGVLIAFVMALVVPAKADVIYDFSISARAVCGLGPGCSGFVGGSLNESGTFLISDSGALLLGSSGGLFPSLPDLDLVLNSISDVNGNSSDFFRAARTAQLPVSVQYCVFYTPNNCSTMYGQMVSFAQVTYSVETVAAVPELSTWAMLLIGFAGIGFVTYRHRNFQRMLTAALIQPHRD